MTSSRMEAFSDGVIAVIVTIMVLELHVPHGNGIPGFITVLPLIAIYVLSFVMVGIYWVNHHELLRRAEGIDRHVLWSNLIFLLTLSFVPFSTDYVGEKHFDSFSAMLYTGAMLLAGIAFFGLRHTVVRMQQQRGDLPLQHRVEGQKHLASSASTCLPFRSRSSRPSSRSAWTRWSRCSGSCRRSGPASTWTACSIARTTPRLSGIHFRAA